jgi:nucleotide-binding universal stress UspA family protein
MALRDLQCVSEAGEEPSFAALEQTMALARGYKAAPSIVVFGPEFVAPKSFINQGWVSSLIASENTKQKERCEAAAAKARELAASVGAGKDAVSVLLRPFTDVVGEIRLRARCYDLTVLDRPEGAIEHKETLFEEVLFNSGRPLIVATPDKAPVERIGTILVAWDGSVHATRALASALGLFPDIARAHIVAVTGEKSLADTVPGTGIAPHLRRHGIETLVHNVPVDERGAAVTIDSQASELGADLIVMGGFGRSRFREFVLGGVTRELSRNARTPVLFNH